MTVPPRGVSASTPHAPSPGDVTSAVHLDACDGLPQDVVATVSYPPRALLNFSGRTGQDEGASVSGKTDADGEWPLLLLKPIGPHQSGLKMCRRNRTSRARRRLQKDPASAASTSVSTKCTTLPAHGSSSPRSNWGRGSWSCKKTCSTSTG